MASTIIINIAIACPNAITVVEMLNEWERAPIKDDFDSVSVRTIEALTFLSIQLLLIKLRAFLLQRALNFMHAVFPSKSKQMFRCLSLCEVHASLFFNGQLAAVREQRLSD